MRGRWLGAAPTDTQKNCLLSSGMSSKYSLSDLYARVGVEKQMSGFLDASDFPLKLVHK